MKPMRWIILLAIAVGATGTTGRAASPHAEPVRAARPLVPALVPDQTSARNLVWRAAVPPTDHSQTVPLAWYDADPPRDDEDDTDPLGSALPSWATNSGPQPLWSPRPDDEPTRRPDPIRPTRRPPIRC